MEKKHILLIENNETDIEFFTDALEESQLNFLCSRARNIEQASKILKNIVPDIIFLDINLPKISGTTFLNDIKTMDYLQKIPVIFYSTLSNRKSDEIADTARYFKLPGNVHTMAKVLRTVVNELSNNVYINFH